MKKFLLNMIFNVSVSVTAQVNQQNNQDTNRIQVTNIIQNNQGKS
jgi:hypothetical protein